MELDPLNKKKVIIEALIKETGIQYGDITIKVQQGEPVHIRFGSGFQCNDKEWKKIESFRATPKEK